MKAYTDLEQSKRLSEILPLESADQIWERIAIASANLDVPEEMEYWHNGNMPYILSSKIGIPCWSLAALLEVLPEFKLEKTKAEDGYEGYYYFVSYKDIIAVPYNKEPIDGFVEMFVRLKNEDLL